MRVTKGIAQLVADAEAKIKTLTTSEVDAKRGQSGVVLIDLRDIRELKREGRIPDTLHIPRGMLEFWVDPESPYYKSDFDHAKEVVLFCNKGWRSALAASALVDMGVEGVFHMAGGMTQWQADGFEVEEMPTKT
ncbi:MAG: rhodanese-like domain-containing protein [Pseudohongiellaceae bacterium]